MDGLPFPALAFFLGGRGTATFRAFKPLLAAWPDAPCNVIMDLVDSAMASAGRADEQEPDSTGVFDIMAYAGPGRVARVARVGSVPSVAWRPACLGRLTQWPTRAAVC